MAVHKDDATPASGDSRKSTLIMEVKEGDPPLTVADVIKAFEALPPETVVSVCLGPLYVDTPLTDAVYWKEHGCVFLLGEIPDEEDDDEGEDDDDEEDDAIEADWVEVPRIEEAEAIDRTIAEPA